MDPNLYLRSCLPLICELGFIYIMYKIDNERSPEVSTSVRLLRYDLEEYAYSIYIEALNKLGDEELATNRLSSEEGRFAMRRIKGRKKRLITELDDYVSALRKQEDAYFSFKIPEFNFPKFKHRC